MKMNIIQRLLGGIKVQTSTAERTLQELRQQLAENENQLASGEGDVVALLEQNEQLTRQIQATEIREQQRLAAAAKEARRAARADLDARADATVTRINTLITKLLLFELQDFQSLVDELNAGSLGAEGRTMEEIFHGLDHNFACNLKAGIRRAAPNVSWDYDAAYPGGREGKPTAMHEVTMLPPAAVRDIYGNPVGTVYQ